MREIHHRDSKPHIPLLSRNESVPAFFWPAWLLTLLYLPANITVSPIHRGAPVDFLSRRQWWPPCFIVLSPSWRGLLVFAALKVVTSSDCLVLLYLSLETAPWVFS